MQICICIIYVHTHSAKELLAISLGIVMDFLYSKRKEECC